ncbi:MULTISPECIES: hypothetical protein [unclassified Paenibacillus]|uniref:hypothetical protein n=1 Tax=unclassified Paenibacillus TaxID=185978 RepID=UPI000A584B99|nr:MULTISPECIES: hypothetical protein [unclassified Paenibacillus]
MSKLVTMCLLVVIVFGICLFVFRPGAGGIQEQLRGGHATMTEKIRSFDYISN